MTYWTEQRVEQLRSLWADGHSASAIQREMRAPSRSAIIGKAYRLGLESRAGMQRTVEPKPKQSKPRKPARIVSITNGSLPRTDSKPPLPVKLTEIAQTNAFPIVFGRAQALLARHAEQCGFPMGDGSQFHYCTNRKGEGKHYCDGHHATCWVKHKKQVAA